MPKVAAEITAPKAEDSPVVAQSTGKTALQYAILLGFYLTAVFTGPNLLIVCSLMIGLVLFLAKLFYRLELTKLPERVDSKIDALLRHTDLQHTRLATGYQSFYQAYFIPAPPLTSLPTAPTITSKVLSGMARLNATLIGCLQAFVKRHNAYGEWQDDTFKITSVAILFLTLPFLYWATTLNSLYIVNILFLYPGTTLALSEETLIRQLAKVFDSTLGIIITVTIMTFADDNDAFSVEKTPTTGNTPPKTPPPVARISPPPIKLSLAQKLEDDDAALREKEAGHNGATEGQLSTSKPITPSDSPK